MSHEIRALSNFSLWTVSLCTVFVFTTGIANNDLLGWSKPHFPVVVVVIVVVVGVVVVVVVFPVFWLVLEHGLLRCSPVQSGDWRLLNSKLLLERRQERTNKPTALTCPGQSQPFISFPGGT